MNLPAVITEFLGTFIFLYVIVATGNPAADADTTMVVGAGLPPCAITLHPGPAPASKLTAARSARCV